MLRVAQLIVDYFGYQLKRITSKRTRERERKNQITKL